MHNVGKIDRLIRVLLALLILALDQFNVIKGDLASGLLFVAVVLAVTGLKGCSPIYSLIGRGTCGLPNDKDTHTIIKPKELKLK